MKTIEDYRQLLSHYKQQSTYGMIVTFSCFALFIPAAITGFGSGVVILPFIVMIGFMGGAIFSAKAQTKIKGLSNEYKETYLPQVIERLLPDAKFYVNGGFDETEIIRSMILKQADRYHSEDLFTGSWEGIGFKTADVVLKDVQNDGKTSTVKTVFQGRVFRLDFQHPFPTDMILIQNRFVPKWSFASYRPVSTESIDFNRSFSTFAKDELHAFVILKPDFMERLMSLDRFINDQISISFLHDKLYIAIKTNKDTFDFSLSKDLSENPIAEFESGLQLIKDLITMFKDAGNNMRF
jgi:hypothetical protein